MANIVNRQGLEDNFSGVMRVLFMDMENIDNIIIEENSVDINSRIEYDIDPIEWNEGKLIKGTGVFTEEPFEVTGKTCVRSKVVFKVAKHYGSRWPILKDMKERRYAVLIVDQNRLGRFMGMMNEFGERSGAEFKWRSSTGEQQGSRNEYVCEFTWESEYGVMPALWEMLPVVEPDIDDDDLDDPLPGVG